MVATPGPLLDLGRAAVDVLMLLFGLAVVVVVANTIRLDVAARTDEIEILALVGAGSSFIRQPFLYSGFWYGVLGGVVAMVLINACWCTWRGPLQRLLESYGEQQACSAWVRRKRCCLLAAARACWAGWARWLRCNGICDFARRRNPWPALMSQLRVRIIYFCINNIYIL